MAWTLVGLGVVLLGATLWVSTWSRDGMGLFVNDLLPGYGFLPGIIPRLGLVGGATLGFGVFAVFLAAVVANRTSK